MNDSPSPLPIPRSPPPYVGCLATSSKHSAHRHTTWKQAHGDTRVHLHASRTPPPPIFAWAAHPSPPRPAKAAEKLLTARCSLFCQAVSAPPKTAAASKAFTLIAARPETTLSERATNEHLHRRQTRRHRPDTAQPLKRSVKNWRGFSTPTNHQPALSMPCVAGARPTRCAPSCTCTLSTHKPGWQQRIRICHNCRSRARCSSKGRPPPGLPPSLAAISPSPSLPPPLPPSPLCPHLV